jgi:hypothetical protein
MATNQFTALSNAAKKVYECYCKAIRLGSCKLISKFSLCATLAAPINKLFSALAGAATIVLA